MFRDRDLAGFGVRVHATGRKTYVVQSRGSAGPKRVTLGLHGDLSADEARKQAAVVIDRIKRGEDPVPVVPETELKEQLVDPPHWRERLRALPLRLVAERGTPDRQQAALSAQAME